MFIAHRVTAEKPFLDLKMLTDRNYALVLLPSLLQQYAGFSLQIVSGLWLMSLDLNVDLMTLALNSVLRGIAVGIFWVPLTIATFPTLEFRPMPEGMALFHLMRNIGSSLFIIQ